MKARDGSSSSPRASRMTCIYIPIIHRQDLEDICTIDIRKFLYAISSASRSQLQELISKRESDEKKLLDDEELFHTAVWVIRRLRILIHYRIIGDELIWRDFSNIPSQEPYPNRESVVKLFVEKVKEFKNKGNNSIFRFEILDFVGIAFYEDICSRMIKIPPTNEALHINSSPIIL